ncbi:MAG: beta-ketoacyl-[acyl-carrier-protein] synthase family protein [Phycisphaerales bacterium]|nr:beta-ketoacyl-[acyl-carrier-protein] synthase family protein [Phycisphaerales bacterium]
MSTRRVVITGMGWVTPLGTDLNVVWDKLLRGESAIAPVTHFDAHTFRTNFAAEVNGFNLTEFLPASSIERHEGAGSSTRFALAAAAQAWRSAGLDRAMAAGQLRARRFGAYLGSGEGTPDFQAFAASNLAGWDAASRKVNGRAWAEAAYRLLDRVREVEQEPNMTLGHIAAEFGCRGPSSNCMTACAASTQAVGEAYEIIRHGDAEVMFAGGSHSMVHPLGMTGFIRLTAMSRRVDTPSTAARPFDQSRDGFVMGEGAGMVVLESLEHFEARTTGLTAGGVAPSVLAEVVGYGSSADSFRITDIQPEGKGAQAAMLQALRGAGINPREPGPDGRPGVHYISAHGTGTEENDKIETAAVKGVFGALAPKVPFSSVKSMFGHLIQAAGAVELITCIRSMHTGVVPPTMNLHQPDPACDLDYVPNAARDLRAQGGVDVCLSNSFGFGGQNNTIIVRRFRA